VTNSKMSVLSEIRKVLEEGDADVLRDMVRVMAEILMASEVDALRIPVGESVAFVQSLGRSGWRARPQRNPRGGRQMCVFSRRSTSQSYPQVRWRRATSEKRTDDPVSRIAAGREIRPGLRITARAWRRRRADASRPAGCDGRSPGGGESGRRREVCRGGSGAGHHPVPPPTVPARAPAAASGLGD
jgi:hypothetical protein